MLLVGESHLRLDVCVRGSDSSLGDSAKVSSVFLFWLVLGVLQWNTCEEGSSDEHCSADSVSIDKNMSTSLPKRHSSYFLVFHAVSL